MTDFFKTLVGYFSDDEYDTQAKHKKATARHKAAHDGGEAAADTTEKRIKKYRHSRLSKRNMQKVSAMDKKTTAVVAATSGKLSAKSYKYVLDKYTGKSPKPRNSLAKTKKNLKAMEQNLAPLMPPKKYGTVGFPEEALKFGYHFNDESVDREVLEPNEEMSSSLMDGYTSDMETGTPVTKTKRYYKVSTYSKSIVNGKSQEFGSYIVNNSDKPFIESGQLKNGKMQIKRDVRETSASIKQKRK